MLSCHTMKATTIIKRLGGPAAIAARLGIRSQAVSLWGAKNRIPAERVPQLERLATELGVPLRAEQMRRDIDWAALRCACAT